MPDISSEHDQTIYQEMMSHPALFSHGSPKKVGILGDPANLILQEVLKHEIQEVCPILDTETINLIDQRIRPMSSKEWRNLSNEYTLDVLIVAEACAQDQITFYFNRLSSDGILIQQCDSPFQIQNLMLVQNQLKTAGFSDVQVLNFPQPGFPTGWRSAFMAKKLGIFRKIREKDIFNKPFDTFYYNFDVHKAAMVLPEFMRHALMSG